MNVNTIQSYIKQMLTLIKIKIVMYNMQSSRIYEPPHDNNNKMACAPTKTQISLCGCTG